MVMEWQHAVVSYDASWCADGKPHPLTACLIIC
jgi:hypothetical protein